MPRQKPEDVAYQPSPLRADLDMRGLGIGARPVDLPELPISPRPMPEPPNAQGVFYGEQLRQLDNPPPRSTTDRILGILAEVGQGITPMQPQQFQQLRQQRQAQEYGEKADTRRFLADQVNTAAQTDRQRAQDARDQSEAQRRAEEHPLNLRMAAANIQRLEQPPPRKFGQRDVERDGKKWREYFDEQSPGVAVDTIELGPIQQDKPIPGRDVPLPPDVETQRSRMNQRASDPLLTASREANIQQMSIRNEDTLRDDYDRNVKQFRELKDQVSRVNEAVSDPSGQGDVALLFNFMKMLDPSSVVRESEYATAQNVGSWATKAQALLTEVATGKKLTPEQRAEFAAVANRLAKSVQPRYDTISRQYIEIARSRGLNPSNVVGADTAPGGGAGGPVSVTDPSGKVHTFPNQAAADAFKKAAGIK